MMKKAFILLLITIVAAADAVVPRDPLFENYPDGLYQDVNELSSQRLPKFEKKRRLQDLFDQYEVDTHHRELFFFRNILSFLRGGGSGKKGSDSVFSGLNVNINFAGGGDDTNEEGVQKAAPPKVIALTAAGKKGGVQKAALQPQQGFALTATGKKGKKGGRRVRERA